ncbi:MAG: 16S rRNA (uracil(1498)-N(3))-methyltransferase [Clostridia bacterium]|nr:16S rRNA (uracil(1498)-N(3))-methyltransferase [Clostridia bacterium]
MPRFFVRTEQIQDGAVTLLGDDAHHISRSLRMAAGEHITVCDTQGIEYDCCLTDFLPDCVKASICSSKTSESEPRYTATLFQALPKGDKLDSIIQKAVECGVSEIYTFESERCIVRIKEGSEEKKTERRARIALEAAKQCGRGRIPTVHPTQSFSRMLKDAAKAQIPLFCYEGEGTQDLRSVLQSARFDQQGATPTVSIVVGSEGGFSPDEARLAKEAGLVPVGLGNRILRTETAAAFVLACLVYEFDMGGKTE